MISEPNVFCFLSSCRARACQRQISRSSRSDCRSCSLRRKIMSSVVRSSSASSQPSGSFLSATNLEYFSDLARQLHNGARSVFSEALRFLHQQSSDGENVGVVNEEAQTHLRSIVVTAQIKVWRLYKQFSEAFDRLQSTTLIQVKTTLLGPRDEELVFPDGLNVMPFPQNRDVLQRQVRKSLFSFKYSNSLVTLCDSLDENATEVSLKAAKSVLGKPYVGSLPKWAEKELLYNEDLFMFIVAVRQGQ